MLIINSKILLLATLNLFSLTACSVHSETVPYNWASNSKKVTKECITCQAIVPTYHKKIDKTEGYQFKAL